MIFLQKSLNCMDLFPEMKGFDIVLDNAPFHRADEIAEIISKKEYRSIYLPPYFLRLNLIKNFWTRRKSYVKKAKFDGTDDLKTRVSEASNKVRPSTLRSIISQLSVNRFDLCECGLFNKPYIDRFQLWCLLLTQVDITKSANWVSRKCNISWSNAQFNRVKLPMGCIKSANETVQKRKMLSKSTNWHRRHCSSQLRQFDLAQKRQNKIPKTTIIC